VTADRASSNDNLLALLDMDKMALSSAGRVAQSRTEQWMRYLGFPGGILVFLLFFYLPLGPGISAAGQAGIACFLLALVWWVTEPFPTSVTSLALMFLLLTTRVSAAKPIMDVLGLEVIWLNLLAFILSSMLVKTRLARRLALWLVLRFGSTAKWALFAFLLVQLALAPLIPATAARAVMTLPLMIVVAAIYGSTEEHPNAFGKNLMLLNLIGISVLSSISMTGSSANLVAVGLIETMAGQRIYYMDWMRLGAPVAILTTVLMWLIGQKWLFKIEPADQLPKLPGGLGVVREKYNAMGPLSFSEKKAIVIFGLVLFLWMTDIFHLRWFGVEISAPFAALLGVLLVLFPRWGVLQWAEADIPWHLLIFSAGAYAGGLALDDTGAAEWAVRMLFGRFDLGSLPFGVAYTIVVGVMMYSHLLTTSKTVRTMIMIPIVITLTRSLGWDPVSFALPAALTIDWVVGLPISGKPNVILFSTNQYSVTDNFKYGMVTCTLGLVILVGSAATWFHWLGVTPAFWSTPTRVTATATDTTSGTSGAARATEIRIALNGDGSATKTVTNDSGTTTTAVTGLLSDPSPSGRMFKFTDLHKDPATTSAYRLVVIFPEGTRALAVREALPKLRKGELVPRAGLDRFDGQLGARLRVDNVQQGETVSLHVELTHQSPPWGWLIAGIGLAAVYLFGFRDLVRSAS
jgi:anion transporter